MAVGDETYITGDSNRDGSLRAVEVASQGSSDLPDLRLEMRRGGRWRTIEFPDIGDGSGGSGGLSEAEVQALIDASISVLTIGAPGALDTLNELANALGDDASYAATITTALALKAPLASPTLTGTPLAPTAAADTSTTQIATTAYVQGELTDRPTLTGTQTLTGKTIAGASNTLTVRLTSDVSGDLPLSSLAQSAAASKLLGRGDSGAGDYEPITLGTGLTMTGTTLSSSGGGGGSVADPLTQDLDADHFRILRPTGVVEVVTVTGTQALSISSTAGDAGKTKLCNGTLAVTWQIQASTPAGWAVELVHWSTDANDTVTLDANGATVILVSGSLVTGARGESIVARCVVSGAGSAGIWLVDGARADRILLPDIDPDAGIEGDFLGMSSGAWTAVALGKRIEVPKTASFTFALTDAQGQNLVRANHASVAIVATVPPDTGVGAIVFPIGTVLELQRAGAASVTLFGGAISTGGNVTINKPSDASLAIRAQYERVKIRKQASNVWDLLDAEVAGSGGLTDGDMGDITVSGTGTVLTVDNDAITYAKVQNVSAASRLLGRGSASGSGDVEELTATAPLVVSSTAMTFSVAAMTAATTGLSLTNDLFPARVNSLSGDRKVTLADYGIKAEPAIWLPSSRHTISGHYRKSLTPGVLVAVQDKAWFMPFDVDFTRALTALGLRPTTGAAGNVEIAIFPHDQTNGRPDTTASARIATSGLLSTAGTALITGTISWSPTPGRYWARVYFSATPTVQSATSTDLIKLPFGRNIANGTIATAYSLASTTASTATAEDISSGWTEETGQHPLVVVS